ncbi:MAG: type I restriction enzyme HsdR N-terminal domain-containing protein [Candidatus Sedimenticola sp. (ex Thyasira tokunagai)]
MAKLPAKVVERLTKETPRFQRILSAAKDRDVNESDTVTIISDMLESVFGFDKYTEVTREFAIQGTFCDLAVKVDGKVEYLIEVKAIGLDLRDSHLRQAVTYGAKEGIKWVVLTNGVTWEVYRVNVQDKVEHEQVCAFNFLELSPRKQPDQEMIFALCRRGVDKKLIEELYEYRKSVNKFMLAAIMMTDPVIGAVRRELRKVKPGLKVTDDEIKGIVESEVLKREVIESETAKETALKVKRCQARLKKKAVAKKAENPED